MTISTQSYLEAHRAGARLALSVFFDGVDLVATTLDGDDATAFASVLSGAGAPWSSFTTLSPGLMATGTVAQKIELYTPEIDAEDPSFTVFDPDGTIAGLVLREGSDHAATTYLTSTLAAGNATTTAQVKSTTDFDSSGTIYVGHEKITYTGKTATSFTGCTRAVNSIFTTNDGDAFAQAHLVQAGTTDAPAYGPAVTTHPRTWYGRFCAVYLHVFDPVAGTWTAPDQSRRVWVGRIKNYSDNGDGSLTFTCEDAKHLTKKATMGQQWSARANAGLPIGYASDSILLGNSATTEYLLTEELSTLTGTTATHEQIAEAINDQFDTWAAAAALHTGDSFVLELVADVTGGPPKYRLSANTAGTPVTGSDNVVVWLNKYVWEWLGFTGPKIEGTLASGDTVAAGLLKKTDPWGTYHALDADSPPAIYWSEGLFQGAEIGVSQEAGTWINQPAGSIPLAEGTVLIGDAIYAVSYTTGTITIQARLDRTTGQFVNASEWLGGVATTTGYVRLGDASEAPVVKQVWYEGDADGSLAGDAVLKLMLSSGTAAYNHADYDTYTGDGFGLGIPASLVDADSFAILNDVRVRLYLPEPKPLYDFLEPILAVAGCHLVWRSTGATAQPKLTIVRPSSETAYQATWALTEDNKADGEPGRTRVTRSPDGLINRFELYYGDGVSSVTNKIIVENVASQSDFGRKRTVKIEAPNVVNAAEVFPVTIAPAVAYFSRPLAVASRSINHTLTRMAPGDSASLVDNYVVNPLSGIRGDGTIYCWVLATSFDLATLRGSCDVVFLPEKDPSRTAPWAPSARVDEAASGAGYDAGTKTLTLKTNEFTNSGEDSDTTYFATGDKVHVYALDDASPLEWFDEVASTGADTITLVTGLAGYDTALLYVVEYDDITTSSNGDQRAHAFIADDSDMTTGLVTNQTPYEYGTDEGIPYADTTVDYSVGTVRPASTDGTQSEPASAHKIVYATKGANSQLAYKTCQNHVSLTTDGLMGAQGATETVVFARKIPLYGHVSLGGIRKIKLRARFKVAAGTGTIKFYTTNAPPAGTDYEGGFTLGSSNSTTATSSSTSYVWSSEVELTPVPINNSGQWETWVVVTAYNSGANTTTVSGISVREVTL